MSIASLLSEPAIRPRRSARPSGRGPSSRLVAAIVILISTAFSLAYVWARCPLDLAPDEAHYWDWSRHLDWSYYSKGPLVAWLIRLSCELLGPLSVELTGSLAAAVRFPALLCHAVTMTAWYVLAAGVFRSSRLGLWVVMLAVLLPVVRIGAVVMTIDPPLLACWSWALVCVWRALSLSPLSPLGRGVGAEGRSASDFPRPPSPQPSPPAKPGREGERRAPLSPSGRGVGGLGHRAEGLDRIRWWLAAATLCALGILAKYTMVLLPIAVVGYLLVHQRREFRRAGIWIMLGGGLLGWLPILYWNWAHDWVTFRHVRGQVGNGSGSGLRWLGPLNFLGGQVGMMFGLWLVAFLFAAWRFRPSREPDPAVRLLWWCSVPVWFVFPVASALKSGQPNWPAPAYASGFILAVAWLREGLSGPHRRHFARSLGVNVVLGLIIVAIVHFPAPVQPLLARIAGPPTERDPAPIRKADITARLLGWKTLAGEVDRLRDHIRAETGSEPVIAGTYWTIPGHLAFSCAGHPDVYAIGIPNHSDRHSQYDFWRPNPVSDAQAFQGRTFVIVGDIGPELLAAFDSFEPPTRVVHLENGIPMEVWAVWVCRGFRGFADFTEWEPGY